MRYDFYDDPEYKQKQAEITHKYWQKGVYNSFVKSLVAKICKNPNCHSSFQVKPYDPKIYCSQRCAAIVSNLNHPKNKSLKLTTSCILCGNKVNRTSKKYCSLKCQMLHRYQIYLKDWKSGKEDGNKGIQTKIISAHLRRYLNEKFGEKCSMCGWKNKNPITNRVPLEIDHIDGNSENNDENNLRLICPNCHSLTPHFRNLNKGNGRAWRQKQTKIV